MSKKVPNPMQRGDIVAAEFCHTSTAAIGGTSGVKGTSRTTFELAEVTSAGRDGKAKSFALAGYRTVQTVERAHGLVKLWSIHAYQPEARALYEATQAPGVEYPDADAMRAAIVPPAPPEQIEW